MSDSTINKDDVVVEDLVYFQDINISQTEDYDNFKDLINDNKFEEAQTYAKGKGISYYCAEFFNRIFGRGSIIYQLIQLIIKPVFQKFSKTEPTGENLNGDIVIGKDTNGNEMTTISWIDYNPIEYSDNGNLLLNPKFLESTEHWYINGKDRQIDYNKYQNSNSFILKSGEHIFQKVYLPDDEYDDVESFKLLFNARYESDTTIPPQPKTIGDITCELEDGVIIKQPLSAVITNNFSENANSFNGVNGTVGITVNISNNTDYDLYLNNFNLFVYKKNGNMIINPYFGEFEYWNLSEDLSYTYTDKWLTISNGEVYQDVPISTGLKAYKYTQNVKNGMHIYKISLLDSNKNEIYTYNRMGYAQVFGGYPECSDDILNSDEASYIRLYFVQGSFRNICLSEGETITPVTPVEKSLFYNPEFYLNAHRWDTSVYNTYNSGEATFIRLAQKVEAHTGNCHPYLKYSVKGHGNYDIEITYQDRGGSIICKKTIQCSCDSDSYDVIERMLDNSPVDTMYVTVCFSEEESNITIKSPILKMLNDNCYDVTFDEKHYPHYLTNRTFYNGNDGGWSFEVVSSAENAEDYYSITENGHIEINTNGCYDSLSIRKIIKIPSDNNGIQEVNVKFNEETSIPNDIAISVGETSNPYGSITISRLTSGSNVIRGLMENQYDGGTEVFLLIRIPKNRQCTIEEVYFSEQLNNSTDTRTPIVPKDDDNYLLNGNFNYGFDKWNDVSGSSMYSINYDYNKIYISNSKLIINTDDDDLYNRIGICQSFVIPETSSKKLKLSFHGKVLDNTLTNTLMIAVYNLSYSQFDIVGTISIDDSSKEVDIDLTSRTGWSHGNYAIGFYVIEPANIQISDIILKELYNFNKWETNFPEYVDVINNEFVIDKNEGKAIVNSFGSGLQDFEITKLIKLDESLDTIEVETSFDLVNKMSGDGYTIYAKAEAYDSDMNLIKTIGSDSVFCSGSTGTIKSNINNFSTSNASNVKYIKFVIYWRNTNKIFDINNIYANLVD